ncbi:DUF2585 domain-containing protein [Breoghania sp. L-A4]|uniref:DUF2585 domain-containing protein n=1 Tax=Breoghania sp. L-A4 TaxID=2304600 RepID=UPI000E35B861|nr:DUF2585 domain-containing protein [Breoghania sp. L-A4]AXS41902.1 DUF2585 domain-containing protein [Breoghania sp. L-A4]
MTWTTGIGLIAATALILLAMGRIPICECGFVRLWTPASDVSGSSQHIADWYTLSHIIHGFLFYWLLWFLIRSRPVGERALGAIAIEAAWEIVENSPWIIDRYREATIAIGYTGDSVLNSVFDIVWMLTGFWFAWRMPVWLTVLVAITFELLALWVIRDNLALNVIMLLYPLEAIKTWQGG